MGSNGLAQKKFFISSLKFQIEMFTRTKMANQYFLTA